ncbi:MAG: OmcA/MtrC family decaheme c-type cytochrome [Myxococcales bacterium]|nr:OmcA/MtrC family decaheme c-type cytochrome [Myxococcales bacterium]
MTVAFSLTDEQGVRLDREGKRTPGQINPQFVLSRLAKDASLVPGQYTALTTRPQTSPITGQTSVQPAADSGGTFAELAPGSFTYTFGSKAQTDLSAMHAVGAYATRTVDERLFVSNAVFHFIPAGGEVGATREVVRTQACNSCHNPLEAHGGARRETALCVLCHSAQALDPDTGNTVDFRVMVHKIHRGEDLPSVRAGTPYRIIGFRQTVFDFSTVAFPQDIRNCQTCHLGAQAEAWLTRPSRAACGSCHDLTAFIEPVPPGMTLHKAGVQLDDAQCALCHPPSGGLVGVAESHRTPAQAPGAPSLELTILEVSNVASGQPATLTFKVEADGRPLDVVTAPLARLAATWAGPTEDYASFATATIQGAGAAGSLLAVDAASGTFRYVFPDVARLPAGAAGTFAFGLEGTFRRGGPTGPTASAFNPVAYAAVGAGPPSPRRTVVEVARCNRCHLELAAHGGTRRNPEYCVMCHNANNTNDERVARVEGATVTAQSVHFKVMIHKIHTGEHLSQKPYVLGGFPVPTRGNPEGTPVDFGEVRFPGDRRDCGTCHAAESFVLPLPAGVLPSREEELACTEEPAADDDRFCDARVVSALRLIPPATAACTSCHDSVQAVAHASTMTSAAGAEACATCHAEGRQLAVRRVHGR